MHTTSLGLLDRLRHANPDAPEWRRLHDLYLPVIRGWLAHVPGLRDEAEDLSQEVFVVLFRELPSFERRRYGSFRAWLRQITVNRIRTYCKLRRKQPVAGLGADVDALLAQLEDANSAPARRWDLDHDWHVCHKLLAAAEIRKQSYYLKLAVPSRKLSLRLKGVPMKSRLVLLYCWISIATLTQTVIAQPEGSVVKVFASVRFPNPVQPWAKVQPQQSIGTGVIIEGKRILTNAHLVAYGTEIYVEDRKGGEKFEASVQALNFDVDLAILKVNEEKLFDKRIVLARAPQLPRIQDRVSIYGFPIGGNDLSVTRGEVSRIEYGAYGRGIGPVIQVSAAINPGNSGGPAVVDDKMIGLVVSRVQNAQNIGSIIPNEEIEIFLDNVKNAHDGKPMLASHLLVQPLENKVLRRKFKVEAAVRGVLVHAVAVSQAKSPLQPFDVLTQIGEYRIDNLGLVQLKNGLRAPFVYLVPQLARQQAVSVTVWRQGQQVTISLPVTRQDNRLIRSYQGEPLSYFIHGPLVFAQGKHEDISLYAQMNRTFYLDNSPLVTRADDLVRFPGEELVVVSSRMFTHASAKGYADPVGKVVKDLNGIAIKNLRHLVEAIRDCTDEFLTIRFADNFSEVLVFDRQELARATEEILEDNSIPLTRRGSPDMLKVWKASPGAGK